MYHNIHVSPIKAAEDKITASLRSFFKKLASMALKKKPKISQVKATDVTSPAVTHTHEKVSQTEGQKFRYNLLLLNLAVRTLTIVLKSVGPRAPWKHTCEITC